ncbi:hypothetical protein K1719_006817 [Acacia pycnantha]|nr:hypothetical protein K1719_006817 [Acacia pycnantha]
MDILDRAKGTVIQDYMVKKQNHRYIKEEQSTHSHPISLITLPSLIIFFGSSHIDHISSTSFSLHLSSRNLSCGRCTQEIKPSRKRELTSGIDELH